MIELLKELGVTPVGTLTILILLFIARYAFKIYKLGLTYFARVDFLISEWAKHNNTTIEEVHVRAMAHIERTKANGKAAHI